MQETFTSDSTFYNVDLLTRNDWQNYYPNIWFIFSMAKNSVLKLTVT